jgi:hypothetical protein
MNRRDFLAAWSTTLALTASGAAAGTPASAAGAVREGTVVPGAPVDVSGRSVAVFTAAAVGFGRSVAGSLDAVPRLHQQYAGLPPVHAINNLTLVVWAICSCGGDFSTAIGDAVSAGWDTDCNGATVGGLCGLIGMAIPERWTAPWNGRVGVGLAGHSELRLDDLVDRTIAVARRLAS